MVAIVDYPNYRIDKHGNVFNRSGHKLKQYESNTGYMRVSLSKHQTHKKFSVHRLVAQAYIPNPNNLPQVNHKDKNKKNNDVDNLEWCDCLYNLTYSDVISKATISKYTPVKCITTNESFPSIKEACEKYNLHYSNVVKCCRGERKTTGGLEWSYQM